LALRFADTRKRFGSGALLAPDAKRKSAPRAKQVRAGAVELVLFHERLSSFLYFFPAQTEFEMRNRLFKRRPYRWTTFLTAHGTVVFPGKIPRDLADQQVVFVGWIEGIHPNGIRYGEVMQCVAIIPVLSENSSLDYKNAIVAKPREDLL
jgi:hypothetical protein